MNTYNKLVAINEAVGMIESNKVLVIAGNEDVLNKLPKGNWIGGTIPYFMNVNGGCFNKTDVFVTDFTDVIKDFSIKSYKEKELSNFIKDRYSNGFSYILIPAFSSIHQKYSIDVYSYPGLYDSPLFGWITGIDLNELGKKVPKVINGKTMEILDNEAVLIHAQIPVNKFARLEILNLFEQGGGDILTFSKPGFESNECKVNNNNYNLAKYIVEKNIDTRLPLVADYSGAYINISIQNVDKENNTVQFYAPVRENIEYKFAKPISNYVSEFNKIIPTNTNKIIASCNCILNYLYSELEGKKTGNMTGPITFGEIAYVLVNQTMVYLSIEDK